MPASVVLLVNAKGGCGATTVATGMCRIAARAGKTAAMVDADLTGRRTMAAMLDAQKALSVGRSMHVYSVAEVDKFKIVELAETFENAFALRIEDLDNLMTSLVDQNDLVVVDAPTPFAEQCRPFFRRVDRVIMITEPNLIGLAATRALMGDLLRFGVPTARLFIATNARSAQRAEITDKEIERTLQCPIIAELPNISDQRGYSKALETFARKCITPLTEAPPIVLKASVTVRAMSSAPSSSAKPSSKPNDNDPEAMETRARADRMAKIRLEINEEVNKKFDPVAASRSHSDGEKVAELRTQIGNVVDLALGDRTDISVQERAQLQQEIIDELLGLGPLEELMRDEKVSEIMINGPGTIYVERGGHLTLSTRTFQSEKHLRNVIERIITPLGRRVDESSPMVDARLADGSRVNAIIEPLALNGSTMTIRRFSKKRLGMQDLVNFGSIAPESVGLLRAMVEGRLNIVVSGGTGSGKTTFLNILSNFIPETERILTIEDAAELSLSQDHVVRLESRPANLEGKGAITIRDLVKNSLRMRPDRIVVGECRSGEALDMLQAMNTGHDGSLTTLHANTPRDALSRLETLVLMAGFDLPIKAIREQIASAVHAVVQIARLSDGSRKCTSISEVVGMEGEIVTMQEIIRFQAMGTDESGKVMGEYQYTGVMPHYAPLFEEHGVDFDIRELNKMKSATTAW